MAKPTYEELAATQSQWISVDDRLPDDDSIVVAAHFYGYGIRTTPDAAVCWFTKRFTRGE